MLMHYTTLQPDVHLPTHITNTMKHMQIVRRLVATFALALTAACATAQTTHKPNIAILATGGTIASRGANSLALTDYGQSNGLKPVGIQTLVEAVPEIEKFANIC